MTGVVCTVCSDEILPQEKIRVTKCHHSFHLMCAAVLNKCANCYEEDPFNERAVVVIDDPAQNRRSVQLEMLKMIVCQLFDAETTDYRSFISAIRNDVPLIRGENDILPLVVQKTAQLQKEPINFIFEAAIFDLISFLLRLGADPLEGAPDKTALYHAVTCAPNFEGSLKVIHLKLVQLLVKSIRKNDPQNKEKVTRVFHSMMFRKGPFNMNDLKIVEALIPYGFDKESKDWQRATIVERANAYRNDRSIISQKVMRLLILGRPLTVFERLTS